MATIAYDGDAPGRGGSGPIFGAGSRVQKVVTGTFTFDSSYPTGGEDISDIFNQFLGQDGLSQLQGLMFYLTAAPITANTKVVDNFPVDHAAKKVMAFGDDTTSGVPAQVANTTDLSAIVLRFVAWGPRV